MGKALSIVCAFVACFACANPIVPFLETHCFECHDDESKKGGLSLESLAAQFGDAPHETWIRIHDRVRDGEMPPKKKRQPSPADRQAFLQALDHELHTASTEQNRAGRVPIRRLSRFEYEHTLHDLLDISIDLKKDLPEDNVVQGFDNISRGLSASATHFIRYQEAADKALATFFAMPFPDQSSKIDRMTGTDFFAWRPKIYHKNILPWVHLDGDTWVYRAELWGDRCFFTKPVKLPGRYRYRCSVRARQSKGKPVPILLGRVKVDRFGRQDLKHVLAIRDAVEDQTRVIEIEVDLPAGDHIYISPYRFRHFRGYDTDEETHDGPQLAVDWVEIEGPLGLGQARAQFVGDLERIPDRFYEQVMAGNRKGIPNWRKWHANEYQKPQNRLRFISQQPKADATRLIAAFLPRALRRPPSDEQLAFYTDKATQYLDDGLLLDEVLFKIYKEILCSTAFLFRLENPGRLDDYALASRLSYFLWNSMPDDKLLEVAGRGELSQPEVLRAQTERLLGHWKARRFRRHFPDRWLSLGEFHEMKPDKLYNEWDDDLFWSLPLETRLFFDEILEQNRPVTEFVHSDWSMLNDRLALHYGIGGVEGMAMRKVKLPPDAHRGGVITQGSILKLTTNATYTSPIKRGVWVLERILGTPPLPPPPDVEAIEPDIRGAVTMREQMELHKGQAVCASCHVKIDPPGFALESFDVLGGWRDRYRVAKGGDGIEHVVHPNHPKRRSADWDARPVKIHVAKPVEPAGELADGSAFQNIDDFKQLLLKDPDQVARNLAGQLLVYGTGSELTYADRRAIDAIVATARKDNYGFRTLLHAVIQSEPFQSK